MRPPALAARRLRILKSASLMRSRHLSGSPRGAEPDSGFVKEMIQNRGSGGHAPLGCLPLWGREGVTLTNSTERIIQLISQENRWIPKPRMGVDTPIPPVGMNAAAPGGAPPRRDQ